MTDTENREAPDEIYEIKLNRFFNIQQKSILTSWGIETAIMMVFLAVGVFKDGRPEGMSIPAAILTVVLLVALLAAVNILLGILPNPKSIDVTANSIKFTHKNMRRRTRVREPGIRAHVADTNVFPLEPTRYSVYDITKIEYKQSALEKTFNAGRISIHGRVSVDGKAKKGIYDEKSNTVTRIKDKVLFMAKAPFRRIS